MNTTESTLDEVPATLADVMNYYGRVLHSNSDLRTSACCATESFPVWQQEILKDIDDEIVSRFYGCGSPIPLDLGDRIVLDLGCGTGRDVFLASRLVGPGGQVIGIDMTEEQIEVGRRLTEQQMNRFNFSTPNVEFRKGYIEDLAAAGISDESVDIVLSNCVINLSPDKGRVFSEIFRVLKPGGELHFSDVFADRRVPQHLREDPVLYGECLAGAMYVEDFRRLLRDTGCPDYRITSTSAVRLADADIEDNIGMINFRSLTVRAFKLDNLEDICEDYGQIAVYRGTIEHAPHRFKLDDHHIFETGKPMLVCGNTAAMIEGTRYGRHFEVFGDRSVHFGAFDCGPTAPGVDRNEEGSAGQCC